MELCDVSEEGRSWSVELDVRDLGGHLDFTWEGSGTQTQTPMATRPHAHAHTQDRQHKGNSAAKEYCYVLLVR